MLSLPTLDEPQQPSAPRDTACDAVDRSVDEVDVDALPEFGSCRERRLYEQTVIGFIHIPFVQRAAIQATPLSGQAIREIRVSYVGIVGRGDADQTHRCRSSHNHEPIRTMMSRRVVSA